VIDDEAIELGARAVACKGWRWLPGMLARYYGDGAAWHLLTDGDGYGLPFKHRPPNPRDAWPDLRDPATLGCLLALVREAWGDPTIHLTCVDSLEAGQYDWIVRSVADKWSSDLLSDSEADALVAALEAAP
jgi:hypothetical protein